MCHLGQSYCRVCKRLHLIALQRCPSSAKQTPGLDYIAVFEVRSFCHRPDAGCEEGLVLHAEYIVSGRCGRCISRERHAGPSLGLGLDVGAAAFGGAERRMEDAGVGM